MSSYYEPGQDEPYARAASGRSGNRGCLFAGILTFLIALGFSLIPFILTYSTLSEDDAMTGKNCTVEIQATVCRYEARQVRIKQTRSPRRRTYTSYHPVYAYEYGGNSYEAESNFGNSTQKYTVGETVTVLVNPDNPYEIFNPDDHNELRTAYLMTLAFPAFVIIIPSVIFFKLKKVKNRMP